MKLVNSSFSSKADLQHKEFPETHFEVSVRPDGLYQNVSMKSAFADALWVCDTEPIPFHSHSFFEIVSCRNTCSVEYMVGTERYRMQKGDVILVPPGVSHCPILPENMPVPFSRDMLWISERTVRGLTEQFSFIFPGSFAEPILFRTAGTRWAFLSDMFQVCVQETQDKAANYESAVVSYATVILVHLCRARDDLQALSMKAEKPELLNQVLAYVEEHLAEKITLAEVSKAFFISESTITQTFRKKMGISFYRCVTQRRLVAAKTFIASGVPLDSVAERVGFSDYSSFFRAFKQETGLSPRQYRKMYNTNAAE